MNFLTPVSPSARRGAPRGQGAVGQLGEVRVQDGRDELAKLARVARLARVAVEAVHESVLQVRRGVLARVRRKEARGPHRAEQRRRRGAQACDKGAVDGRRGHDGGRRRGCHAQRWNGAAAGSMGAPIEPSYGCSELRAV